MGGDESWFPRTPMSDVDIDQLKQQIQQQQLTQMVAQLVPKCHERCVQISQKLSGREEQCLAHCAAKYQQSVHVCLLAFAQRMQQEI